MRVLRVYIKGWTASYRYPPIGAVGLQMTHPSFPIPPPSTVYGIISAAIGRIIKPNEAAIGYVAPFKAKARDLEVIYQIGEEGKVTKRNVVNREFIYGPELYIYLTNLALRKCFLNPRYPILLGRSSDLGFVKEVKIVELHEVDEARFLYTMLPFPLKGVSVPIFALPISFTDEVPRRTQSVKGLYLIEKEIKVKGKNLFFDPEKNWGVFFHGGGNIC